jgi:hypothetical protein
MHDAGCAKLRFMSTQSLNDVALAHIQDCGIRQIAAQDPIERASALTRVLLNCKVLLHLSLYIPFLGRLQRVLRLGHANGVEDFGNLLVAEELFLACDGDDPVVTDSLTISAAFAYPI